MNIKFIDSCYIIRSIVKLSIFLSLLLFLGVANAAVNDADAIPTQVNPSYHWSALWYYGNTAEQTFGQILSGKFSRAGENIYTIEMAYAVDQDNWFKKIFKIILVDSLEVAGNFTLRQNTRYQDVVNEGNFYLIWRWSKFPWNNFVVTTFGFGDGISYASHVPYVDKITAEPGDDLRRLLNYMMVEATFAAPAHPAWALVLRLHHRCTMGGVYGHNNAGSTSVGLGVRYKFNF